ncbi:hypothetical protein Leryth_022798 [Lithospermum erythrorhizon]|nr:hypothetical protein Leryth_022798 [Lithospermum erythrorhizon]
MCSNFWPCTDHPMDHGLNGHCLKGLCPGDRRPPPQGRINKPGNLRTAELQVLRIHERPSKAKVVGGQEGPLEIWDLRRKCEGCNKPADGAKENQLVLF